MKEERKTNQGKSRCCKAEIEYSGGSYDGEDIVPVKMSCTKCRKPKPSVIQRVGRPAKIII